MLHYKKQADVSIFFVRCYCDMVDANRTFVVEYGLGGYLVSYWRLRYAFYPKGAFGNEILDDTHGDA